jgi:hypothetical protein
LAVDGLTLARFLSGATELGNPHGFPTRRSAAEFAFQGKRQLDVEQGVAAQAFERVVDAHMSRIEGACKGREHAGAGRRAQVLKASAQRSVVDLARSEARQGLRSFDLEMRSRQAGCCHQDRQHPLISVFGRYQRQDTIIVTRDSGRDSGVAERDLDRFMAQAQARNLRHSLQPADHREEAAFVPCGDIAGAQLGDPGSLCEIATLTGVAHHHVRSAVDEFSGLAWLLYRIAGVIHQPQRAARDRDADGPDIAFQSVRRDVSDPGCRLGLSIHHEKAFLPIGEMAVKSRGKIRRHASSGNRHETQRGQFVLQETRPVHLLERIGDPADAGAAGIANLSREACIRCAPAGEVEARSRDQMRVQNRKPIGIVERQDECRLVPLLKFEIAGDGTGIGLNGASRQSDISALAGAARGAEQQCQIGVEATVWIGGSHYAAEAAVHWPAYAIGREIRNEVIQHRRLARRQQGHGVPAMQSRQIRDDRMFARFRDDADQALFAAEAGGLHRHATGKLPVRDGCAIRENQRRTGAEALKPFRESHLPKPVFEPSVAPRGAVPEGATTLVD